MGGSAAIHAAANGLRIDGMILLDPQLDVFDSLMTGGKVNTGIPAPFFAVAARAAIHRFALPHGPTSPLRLATQLDIPILLMQDWDDPVTRSPFAAELAGSNRQVMLKPVPAIQPADLLFSRQRPLGVACGGACLPPRLGASNTLLVHRRAHSMNAGTPISC